MEKLKSNLQNMVIVLVLVAVICGGLLAFVNMKTQPARDAAADKTLNDGIAAVLGGNAGKKIEEKTVKRNVNGKSLEYTIYKMENGTAVKSTDPNGFGGNLSILVGFDNEGTIKGYTILETAETPGLGAKADKWFQGEGGEKANIVGKNPGKMNMTVSKDGGDVDAITASTITSRSFLRAVKEAYNTYMELSGAKAECPKANCPKADASTGATKQAKK